MAPGTGKTRVVLLSLLVFLSLPLHHAAPQNGAQVTTISGKKTCTFSIDLARTPEQHERGLMFRKTLPPGKGMLFLFPDEAPRYFWMKNTLLALDIIFIDSRRKVVDVHRNARPLDETIIASRKPARYVLEVAAGRAEACSVIPGSRLKFRGFSD